MAGTRCVSSNWMTDSRGAVSGFVMFQRSASVMQISTYLLARTGNAKPIINTTGMQDSVRTPGPDDNKTQCNKYQPATIASG